MIKQKMLWVYFIVGFFIFTIHEFLIFTHISNHQLMLSIHLIEAFATLVIVGILLSRLSNKTANYKKLKMDEERLHTLINSMVDAVIFKDGEGRWIEANTFALRIFNLENIPYKGKTDMELIPYSVSTNSLLGCMKSDEQAWEGKHNIHSEELIPLRDGTTVILDTIKIPLFHNDGSRKGLVIIGRDITANVHAKQEMCANEQRYKSLFHYNPEPMMMMDLGGLITTVNPRFEAVTGYSKVELLGTSFLDLHCHEEKRLIDSFDYVIENHRGINSGDVTLKTKHNKEVILSCTFVPILINEQLVGVNCYTQDVTKVRAAQEKLKNSEKLSIVGELAASVAHEVRNPLTSLKGFVQLLQGTDEQHDTYYSIMLSELDRINLIVGELLVIAKPQKTPFQKQQIVPLILDVKTLLEAEAHFHATLMYIEAKEPLPLLFCEANQLRQVFINMIKNAMEADARHIWITVEEVGPSIVVTIEDDGCGIEQERLKHLGEPFYSSKERGTGLGLTVSYRIIEAHKGSVTVQSAVSQGTTVQIELPIQSGE